MRFTFLLFRCTAEQRIEGSVDRSNNKEITTYSQMARVPCIDLGISSMASRNAAPNKSIKG